jgi:hypothetical protein
MNALARLRFKIVTSFLIAGLGVLMFLRLAVSEPMSGATLIGFLAPVLFVIAGVWRAIIFLKAVRGFAKP